MPTRFRPRRLRPRRPSERWLLPPVVAAALVAAILAACTPAPAPLTDPRAILDQAVAHLRTAHSVHLEVTVDGSLALAGLLGGPQASGQRLGLTGTHLAGDVDLAGARADLHFQVPALLGLEGELRQLGTETYLESSLTSRGWHRLAASDLPAPLDRPAGWLDALTTWLDRPATVPLRLDDSSCASGSCYVVRIAVSRDDLQALASGAFPAESGEPGVAASGPGLASEGPGIDSGIPGLPSSIVGATVSVDLRVDRSSLVLSEAAFHVDLGSSGSLTVSATFSAWDAGVAVAAPPDSEIVSGPLFP